MKRLAFALVLLVACGKDAPAASPGLITTTAVDPSVTTCVATATALDLGQKAKSGVYTADELFPQLQKNRDDLFADADLFGTVTIHEATNDQSLSDADLVYQLGLGVGGLATGLAAGQETTGGSILSGMTDAQANLTGLLSIGPDVEHALGCP